MSRKTARKPKLTDAERHKRFVEMARQVGASDDPKDFDKAFIDQMVDDHQKDINEFQDEAKAKNGQVSALARKQLPTLKKHLATAQSLQKQEQAASN